jgi:hypothetical protein
MTTARHTATNAAGDAARRGLWGIARLVSLLTSIVVGIIVVGIVLVWLEANPGNGVVEAVLDASRWLAGPFDDAFTIDSHKWAVTVNWGIAGVVYSIAGGVLARLLRR